MSGHRARVFARSGGRCIYCAGRAAATTIDHMPPISMFHRRDRPKGLEFASCEACNQGARKADLVAAFLGRIYPDAGTIEEQNEIQTLLSALARHLPGFLQEMNTPKARERRLLRELGDDGGGGLFLGGPIATAHMDAFCARLGFALHFEATGEMVPEGGGVAARFFTNVDLLEEQVPPEIFDILPSPQTLRAGEKHVDQQFRYASCAGEGGAISMSYASFRLAFSVTAFAARNREILEGKGGRVFAPGDLAIPRIVSFYSGFQFTVGGA